MFIIYIERGVYATAQMWKSEDNLVELIFSCYIYMGSRNQMQVVRLVQQEETLSLYSKNSFMVCPCDCDFMGFTIYVLKLHSMLHQASKNIYISHYVYFAMKTFMRIFAMDLEIIRQHRTHLKPAMFLDFLGCHTYSGIFVSWEKSNYKLSSSIMKCCKFMWYVW